MKKAIMCFLGAMMVLSLAACTPTTEKNKSGEVKKVETTQATQSAQGAQSKPGVAPEKQPDPDAPELDVVAIYTVKEDKSGIAGTMDSVDAGEVNENTLLNLLIQYQVLNEGTEIVSFDAAEAELNENAVGPGADVLGSEYVMMYDVIPEATLNLSAFPEDGKNEQVVKAVAKTFIENMNIESLTIQVNGETIAEKMTALDVE